MRPFPRLTIATALVAAMTFWVAPAAIGAQPGAPLGYAISAVGFNAYFVFDTQPGRTVKGTLRLLSLTPRAKTILVSPVDVSTAADAGLQYGSAPPVGVGRWLNLRTHSVRLSGTRSADVPFTVHVPSGARPGDHFAAIIALDRRVLSQPSSGKGPIRLRVIPRLAMTVLVRLPGPRTRALAIGGAKIEVAPSGASLALAISSPGNTLIRSSTGGVTVSQGGKPLFSQTISLAAFVPGTSISYHVPWKGTPVEGLYRVKGEIHPTGARVIVFDRTIRFGHNAIRRFRAETGRSAIESSGTPILVTVALALALAAALGFGLAYLRSRRQLSRHV